MNSTDITIKAEREIRETTKDLAPFIPKVNPRLNEAEQLRLEKKARIFIYDATRKMRGKQWDLALSDIERARKLGVDLGWKEMMVYADTMREQIGAKRLNSMREANDKVSQERFDRRRSARVQRETTEATRLVALGNADNDRIREFMTIVKASKKVEISSLAKALDINEAAALERAIASASQFGFKVEGDTLSFGKGDKDKFLLSFGL